MCPSDLQSSSFAKSWSKKLLADCEWNWLRKFAISEAENPAAARRSNPRRGFSCACYRDSFQQQSDTTCMSSIPVLLFHHPPPVPSWDQWRNVSICWAESHAILPPLRKSHDAADPRDCLAMSVRVCRLRVSCQNVSSVVCCPSVAACSLESGRVSILSWTL